MPVRRVAFAQGGEQELQPRPVLVEQRGPRVVQRGELQQHRQEVGQFVLHQLPAGHPVTLLQRGQRLAAPAGVAVGVVGQVEAAAPLQVERLHVVGGQLAGAQLRGERQERGEMRLRGLPDERQAAPEAFVRIGEQVGGGLPDDGGIHDLPFLRGKSPAGAPRPSQLSRLTRSWVISSPVWRSFRPWKLSIETGTGRPDASPNGPCMPGPPS